jgi:dethiobiotin synthetase
MDVILAVGLRLGCLNHAFLTVEAIAARGLTLAGWVANHLDPGYERIEANLETLCARIPAPCLGVVPRMAKPEIAEAARHLAEAPRLLRISLE